MQTDQRTAQLLGYLGLVPFVGLVILVVLDVPLAGVDAATALSAYAALILSFLGGISWGLAIAATGLTDRARRDLFLVSVIPSLVGWLALLLPFKMGVWILVAAFALVYLHDRRVAANPFYPVWFQRLRLVLTSVAVLCIASAGATG